MAAIVFTFFLHLLETEARYRKTECVDATFFALKGRCFHFVNKIDTFRNAREYCIEKGGDLSDFILYETYVYDEKFPISYLELWYPAIESADGFQSRPEIRRLDGRVQSAFWYPGWPPNTDDANCATIIPKYGLMMNHNCDFRRYFICETHPGILFSLFSFKMQNRKAVRTGERAILQYAERALIGRHSPPRRFEICDFGTKEII